MASNNWWTRNAPGVFGGDASGAEQVFNAEQAQLTREFNANEALLNRTFNAEEAQKNRDFQAYLSNTSYQRARSDMLAAGLNPYLAYGQGGASTPSGSAASGSPAYSSTAASASHGRDFMSQLFDFVKDVADIAISARKA